jgi:putative NADPH-quinone reductase
MLKGYFDRVWNHGRLYGTKQKANARSIVWVAIAGLSKSTLAKHGHDTALKAVLSSGIANYCGIGASSLVILADTIDNPDISRYKNEVGKAIDEALDSIRV